MEQTAREDRGLQSISTQTFKTGVDEYLKGERFED